jgi:hypothetical protein
MPPAYRRTTRSALALACLLAASGACTCGGSALDDAKCLSDADCPSEYFCNIRTARCEFEKFECAEEGQCCPGQICAQGVVCFDKFTNCTADATCTVKGQVCRAVSTQSTDLGCTFEKCGESGSCPEGLDCFNGYCVGEAPCNRSCPQGQVCTPVNNRCFEVGTENGFPPTCAQTCAPGTVLVFVDGYNVFNRCDRDVKDCKCEPLPPVRPKDMARHSSLAVSPTKLLVSAYSSDHGDLVLHTFSKSDGKLEKTEWIDGVPTTGAVVADPNGPRAGRIAPGPDVGTHTSIAYDPNGSITHVAYYAVRDGNKVLGDLRYARRSGGGAWSVHTVDGADEGGIDTGDAGLYTSLALSPEGHPVIAYFQRSGVGGSVRKSGVKVARARVREPARASDWVVTLVQDGATRPPPCVTDTSSGCGDGDVCVALATPNSNSNGECRRKSARPGDCKNPSCESSQVCAIDDLNAPRCFTSLRADTLAKLPDGNGLFPSIAYLDGKPLVAWYDRANGLLKASLADSDGVGGAVFTQVRVLDQGFAIGTNGGAKHDVGQFASLAVGPADPTLRRIAVAYHDVTSHQLRLYTAKADFSDAKLSVLDAGVGDPETDSTLFVGTDPSVRFDESKNILVLYQDATRGDLRLASQSGGVAFGTEVLREAGANGFFGNLAVDGPSRFVSHVVIKARSQSESGNKLEVFRLP